MTGQARLDLIDALVAEHAKTRLLDLARTYGVRTYGRPTKRDLVVSLLNMGWKA